MNRLILFLSFLLLVIIIAKNNNKYLIDSIIQNQQYESVVRNYIPVFEDKTLAWGLYADHHQSGKHLTGLNEVLGSGACVLDYNNDGWEDLLVIGGSGHHRFYGKSVWWGQSIGDTFWENTGDGSFRNVTSSVNIPKTKWSMGCATGDIDNDGNVDVLILNYGRNTLLKNNGDGTFSDVTQASGLYKDESWSLSASMADYDGDGLLDIYIVNFVDYKKVARVFERSSGFLDTASASFDPVLYDSQSNQLYQNQGDFRFINKAEELNVADTTGRGKAARWLDVDNDLEPDLIVLNSSGTPNQLYINNPGKVFSTNPDIYRIESATGSHSVAAGDIDNDGDVDMIVSRPAGSPPMMLVNGSSRYKVQSTNALTNGFTDLTWELGLGHDESLAYDGWGISLADFNNNGWVDAYSANGSPAVDPDSTNVTIGQPDTLWINQGGFFELSSLGDPYVLPGRGLVSADFNNDGRLDLLVTHNNGFARLLINKTDDVGHWLGIKLVDKERSVIGSKVTVKVGENSRAKQYYFDSSYLSQGSDRIHFGLDDKSVVDQVLVVWPDGSKKLIYDIKADQYIVIDKNRNSYTELPVNKVKEKILYSFFLELEEELKDIYIELLGMVEGDERAVNELLVAYQDQDDDKRLAALEGLYKTNSQRALSAIYDALSDSNDEIKRYGISLLAQLELEQSVSWLMNALSDSSQEVRCDAAKTFEHFFREEEAVIHRKYLSVPYLISLLEDKVPYVRVCAAKALAESESYRAIVPLINHLMDEDDNVRASAARALGFIRDIKAEEPLKKVVFSSDQAAIVKANALVSLKMINSIALNQSLDHLFVQPETIDSVKEGVDIINELFNIEGGVVLDRNLLLEFKKNLVKRLCAIDERKNPCYENKTRNSVIDSRREKPKMDKISELVKKSGIRANKELMKIVRDEQEKDDLRMRALEFLAKKKYEFAKLLVLEMAASENKKIANESIMLLDYFSSEKVVRDYLWSLLTEKASNGNRNINNDIRLSAAKVLVRKEPRKVMDHLLGL